MLQLIHQPLVKTEAVEILPFALSSKVSLSGVRSFLQVPASLLKLTDVESKWELGYKGQQSTAVSWHQWVLRPASISEMLYEDP